MTRAFRMSRRHLIVSTWSGVLGVAVLGTTAACGGSDSDSGSGGTAAAQGGVTPSPSQAPTGTASSAGDLTWQQVSLSFVSAYVLVRSGEAAVVDTGTDGSTDAIGAGLTAAGVGWDAVRHVVLTHKHPDHIGGLAGVAQQASGARLYVGAGDLAAVPAPGRELRAVGDDDDVFGLQVLDTPGHTAGHISVFDTATGVLVAGDALRTTDGLQGSDPRYTEDEAAAADSVRKLAALDVQVVLPGHGDPLTEGASDALKQLAASLPT